MGDQTIPQLKQQLQQELNSPENFARYLQLLRDWFGQRLTKHMFDYEVSSLFSEKCFILHNQLLHGLLLHCVTGSTGTPSSRPSGSGLQSHRNAANSSGNTGIGNVASSPFGREHDGNNNANIYIIPPVPGEEPFIYPPDAKDYPPPPSVDAAQVTMDMMEQDPPPDCDWKPVKLAYYIDENDVPATAFSLKNRFPPWFADEFHRVNKQGSYARGVNGVPNVTRFHPTMKDILERKPHLKPHFVVPRDKNAPYQTSGCSLHGRFLVKAWRLKINNVNMAVTDFAVKAIKANIKNIIVAMLKQRRPFRMRDKRILHSVGVPCPNPYLRQAHHLYDETYGSDTTKMADVVMQVPAPFPTLEEKERLAALQVASSCSANNSRFISEKGTMLDLLLALEENPSLIPNNRTRFKMMDIITRKTKGFAGSHNSQYSHEDEGDDDEISHLSSQTLPVVSY